MEACPSVSSRPSSWRCRQWRGLRPVGILSCSSHICSCDVNHAMLLICMLRHCFTWQSCKPPRGAGRSSRECRAAGIGHMPSANSPRSRTPGEVSKAAERCRDHGTTIITVHGGHGMQNWIIVHMRSWEPPWPRCCRPGALRSRWHYYRPHAHWSPPSAVGRGKSTLSFQPADTMSCGGMWRSWSVKWPNNLNFMMSVLAFPNPPCRVVASISRDRRDESRAATGMAKYPGRSSRSWLSWGKHDWPRSLIHIQDVDKRLLQGGGGRASCLRLQRWRLARCCSWTGSPMKGSSWKMGIDPCMHACVFNWAAKWDRRRIDAEHGVSRKRLLAETLAFKEWNSAKPSSSKSKHVKTLPACHHIPGASGTHLQWRSHSAGSESLSRKCRKDPERPHVSRPQRPSRQHHLEQGDSWKENMCHQEGYCTWSWAIQWGPQQLRGLELQRLPAHRSNGK